MQDLPQQEIFQLLNLISKGDDKAFKKIYIHYQSNLIKFIRYQIYDESYVDEILHDTFMVVFKNPLGFDGSSKFSTWLCGIAINKCKDWRRKYSKEPKTEELDEEMINSIPDDNKSLWQALIDKERDDVFKECVKALPINHREAISLAYLNDEKIQSIAKTQACPIGTVKSRLSYARQKIADCMHKALGNGALR